MAELRLNTGDLAGAEAALADAFRLGVSGTLLLIEYTAEQVAVRLAVRQGETGRAMALADGMLARLRTSGAAYFLPAVLHTKAQALLAAGDAGGARSTLYEAAAAAKKASAWLSLWPILHDLEKLEAGDARQARRLRQELDHTIDGIAKHITGRDLRTCFFARSALQ